MKCFHKAFIPRGLGFSKRSSALFPPLPHLLPCLNELLNRTGSRKAPVVEVTFPVGFPIEIVHVGRYSAGATNVAVLSGHSRRGLHLWGSWAGEPWRWSSE